MTHPMVYTRNPEFVSRKIGGEFVLIPLKRQIHEVRSIFSLNAVGGALWELIDGKRTRQDLHKEMLSLFEVDDAALASDLDEILSQLEEIQAIQKV